jgi:hypothetical protein
MPAEDINALLEKISNYAWISYVILVLFAIVKYLVVAGIIQIGLLINSIEVTFSKILKVVIIAEFVFLIPVIIKIIWFSFFIHSYNLKDISFFSPLSALNLFSIGTIKQMWVYPLSLINLFELAYIYILAFGIKKVINQSFDNSLKIIAGSYLPGLSLWVIFTLFLTVMTNPV